MVTSVDADSEVFPYLRMHANMNRVDLVTLNKSFDDLTAQHLEGVDVLIGADICFWDTMVDSLKRLIWRAFHSDVQAVVIADPGRSTFHRLGEHFIKRGMGKILHWTVQRPHPIQGLILRVVPPAH